MAENVTTLFEKWQKQKQEHPEWTPSLEDLLYFIHGSGSDSDRIYSVEQLRDLLQTVITSLTGLKNISISYSSNDDGITITGSHGSIYIEGGNPPKIRFVSNQGGPRSELTYSGLKLVNSSGTESEKQALQSLDADGNFTADKSYVLESSQATPRQFKVKSSDGGAYSYMDIDKVAALTGAGNTVINHQGVTITKKTGTGSESVSMSMSESNDSVTFDKPIKLVEYRVGTIWKLINQSTQSGSAFVLSRRNGDDWNDELIFNSDGSVATFNSIVKSKVGFDLGENWRFIKGQGDSLVIQLYDGADWNDVAIFKNDGTLLTVKPELKVGNITVEKVKGDGNNLQVCGFSFSSPTGGAYKHEINGYDGTNIASRIYNMVLDTTARKIMKASQNNSIELLDGEIGLVKVPRGSGTVQITETNTQTTCTCVAESGSDRVYLVARVDNKIYVVM